MSKTDKTKFALPNQMKIANVDRVFFTLTVPEGVDLSDVMEPTYLSSCIGNHNIKQHTRIEVCAPSWWAELLVIAVNPERKTVWTKAISKKISLDYDPTEGSKNYEIAPGIAGRHAVRLGRKTLKDFATMAEAKAWIENRVG